MSDKPNSEFDKMRSQMMVREIVEDLKEIDEKLKHVRKKGVDQYNKKFRVPRCL